MTRAGRTRLWIVLGAVVLIAAFLTASLRQSGRGPAAEVQMEDVRRARLESWVRAPGEVRPEKLVQISSNLMGRVQGLSVAEGDRVNRGDLLLRLDDERYRSTLAATDAQVEAAQADLRLAQAQHELSQQTLRRQEQLFADSLLSDEALDRVRAEAAMNAARLAAAREALRVRQAMRAETGKDFKETVFHSPITGVVTALNVEEGENVVTGTMNNPGTVIMTIADLDTMEVEADVDETDVVKVQVGQSARVKTDAWEDSVLAGVVTKVGLSGRRTSASGQQEGTNYMVRVRILSPPEGLRPGMSADVEILTGARDSALVVPIQALTAHPEGTIRRWMEDRENGTGSRRGSKGSAGNGDRDAGGGRDGASTDRQDNTGREDGGGGPDSLAPGEKLIEGVFLERDRHAVFVPVQIGLRGDTEVEVGGEIRPGDRVITGPYRTLRKLKDGEAVKQEKAKKKKDGGNA